MVCGKTKKIANKFGRIQIFGSKSASEENSLVGCRMEMKNLQNNE